MRTVILTWTFVFVVHLTTEDISVQNFTVAEGTTVYLSCKSSDKVKQRWAFKRTPQSRKEFISTLFKNSTVKKERDDPACRFTHTAEHLIISDLQPQDSGLYLCNNRAAAVLTVSTESTDTENSSPEINRYVAVAVLLVLCIPAIVCVCLLSAALGRRRMKTRRETELTASGLELRRVADEDPCVPNAHEDQGEVQYASLGVQRRTDTDTHESSRHHHVIYSTLLTDN